MARANGTRLTSALPPRSSALARSWIHEVTSVSAGPPLGGLYLKPPSAGGLCDGVITIPSPGCSARPRLYTRIACEITGVGVNPSSRWRTVSTPSAARTSSAVPLGGAREGVRVLAQEQRPVDPPIAAVVADRPGDRQDVRLGERVVARRAPVPAGAEGDALPRVARIGTVRVIGVLQRREVDQDVDRGRLARQGMDRHRDSPSGVVDVRESRYEFTRRGSV